MVSDNAWDQALGPIEIQFAVSGMNRTRHRPVQLRQPDSRTPSGCNRGLAKHLA